MTQVKRRSDEAEHLVKVLVMLAALQKARAEEEEEEEEEWSEEGWSWKEIALATLILVVASGMFRALWMILEKLWRMLKLEASNQPEEEPGLSEEEQEALRLELRIQL